MAKRPSSGRARRIAIYGKGGVGKSTVASALSLLFLRSGSRVLQIGCDPKADSCHLHVPIDKIRPLMPSLVEEAPRDPRRFALSRLMIGRDGVHCLEAGGPDAGRGCAGFGVSSALKVFDRIPGFYERYDVILYDVLGDVVCGGFAWPLRPGRADEVYILVSGDVASAFAANAIARAVRNNAEHGARLAGLIVNRAAVRPPLGAPALGRLARRLGTRVVAEIPADPLIPAAAARGATALERFPRSPAAQAYRRLHEALAAVRRDSFAVPSPLPNADLLRFLRQEGAYGSRA